MSGAGPIDPRGAKIGFLGLGLMGFPIAANLARAGADLMVWNRTGAKAEALVAEHGGRVAGSPVELARHADVLISMVADGEVLEDIYFSDPELVAALGAGGIAIDMGTIGPVAARDIGARLAEHGVPFIDAPVSGSTAAATEATLAIFVGADPTDFERVEPILSVLGNSVTRIGDPGQAALVKLAVNNLIYGINQCVSEALVLAERSGLERQAVYDTFLGSAAAAPVMGYRRDAFVHPEDTQVSFTIRLTEKDLRLTAELADQVGAPMPQAKLNREIAQEAIEGGFGERDVSAIAEYLRHRASRAGQP